MLKTVIFDMDGVIIDSEPIHHDAFFKVFDDLNIEVSELYYDNLKGFSTKNAMQRIVDDFQLNNESVAELVERKRSYFNDLFDTKTDLRLIPGVFRLIQDLHQKGLQLILASSSAKVTIDRIFRRFELYPYFTHIISGEEFPQSKPNPAIFLRAQELSQHSKQECIVIEDSTNGILAAHRAEIFCIAYKSENSHNQDLSLADAVIDNFEEIERILHN